MPKTTIGISGGLGNQLFQFALGLSRFGIPGKDFYLSPDVQSRTKWSRPIEIHRLLPRDVFFNTDFRGSRTRLDLLHHQFVRKDRLELSLLEAFGSNIVVENKKLFDAELVFLKDHFFRGSFIHPAYWGSRHEEVLEKIYVLLENISDFDEESTTPLPILGIHIRRGDYVNNPKALNFHGICGRDYYQTALASINDLNSYEKVMIFSDDTRVAENFFYSLKISHPNVVIDSSRDPIKVLSKMCKCTSLIACNSTLSWWGAFLGHEKTRVFPTNWFLDSHINLFPIDQFFPLSVMRIENKLLLKDDLVI